MRFIEIFLHDFWVSISFLFLHPYVMREREREREREDGFYELPFFPLKNFEIVFWLSVNRRPFPNQKHHLTVDIVHTSVQIIENDCHNFNNNNWFLTNHAGCMTWQFKNQAFMIEENPKFLCFRERHKKKQNMAVDTLSSTINNINYLISH